MSLRRLRSVLNFSELALVGHFRIRGLYISAHVAYLYIIYIIQIYRIITIAQELYSFPKDCIIFDGHTSLLVVKRRCCGIVEKFNSPIILMKCTERWCFT